MAKSTTTAAEGSELPETVQATTSVEGTPVLDTPAPAVFEITLAEFMQKLSLRDNRVEMVNAFYFTEKGAGAVKARESDFQSRFEKFTNLVIEG